MRISNGFLIFFCTIVVWNCRVVSVQADPLDGIITDKLPHPMTALAKPALLETAVDPQFGTTIRRISNAGSGHVIKPMYSTIPAWNADESYLILYHTQGAPYAGSHVLYDGKTYQFIKVLNDTAVDLEQIHWDPVDPDIFYYPSNYNNLPHFMRYHVSTDQVDLVHDFGTAPTNVPADGSLSFGSDPQYMSWDAGNRVVGLQSGNKKIIYSITDNLVLGMTTVSTVNAPVVSPSGNLVFLDGKVYSSSFVLQRTLPMAVVDEHASIGKKADGTNVYNTIDFDGAQPGNLVSWNLSTGVETIVVGEATGYPYPLTGTHFCSLGLHVPGYVSVDIVGDVSGATLLDNELLLVDLNTNRVGRVAYHRSYGGDGPNGYWAEPHAVLSPSGTRILFGSDWGGGDSVDTYVVELPSYTSVSAPATPRGFRVF